MKGSVVIPSLSQMSMLVFFFFTLNFNLKHIRRQFAVAYKSMVQGVATFRLV